MRCVCAPLLCLLSLALPRATHASCKLLHDGRPAATIDCTEPGAWSVRCDLPDEPGQVLVHLAMPGRGLEATAGLPLSARGSAELPLSGPKGRSGVFLVDKPQSGLLSGQALGPGQICPIVQPEVAPGSPRKALPLEIVAKLHQRKGARQNPSDPTVLVPAYDEGIPFAALRIPVHQRPVGTVPVLLGQSLPREEELRGRLQVLVGEGDEARWSSFGFSGSRREIPVDSGDVSLLVADFVGPEVDAALQGDGASFLAEDLALWLSGEPGSRLGAAAWARSGFQPELLGERGATLAFRPMVALGRSWWATSTERLAVRIGSHGERLRVAIAWRAAPWDETVLAAIDAEIERGISDP